jgi:hypothetical protein
MARQLAAVGMRAASAGARYCVALVCVAGLGGSRSVACPFCDAVRPTFAERRAEADVVVLAEARGGHVFRIVQAIAGGDRLDDRAVVDVAEADDTPAVAAGKLALLLGKHAGDARGWEVIAVDETSAAYFIRAPLLKRPIDERLRYAAKYLEHADPLVADDAFREFGRAPFDAVAGVADVLPFARLRQWLVDPAIPSQRKGVYGLMLGLATDPAERGPNVALLRRIATAEAGDFRSGFDGVLGGLLAAEGEAALDLIDERLLVNPRAAEGDVRHAQTALRFYVQYGKAIGDERLNRSLRYLLDRPATAAAALGDLTRRRDWSLVERAAKMFRDSPGDDPALDRAVVGYLLVCPKPEASAALRGLRGSAADRVADAENYWITLGIRSDS